MPATAPTDLTIGTRAGALNAVRESVLALGRASYFAGHLHGWSELDEKIQAACRDIDALWSELNSAPMPLGDDREMLTAVS